MMTESFGANLVLAHEVATDNNLVVNGYDIMKMQNNILMYLATRPLAERADIQNIVNASQGSTIYRIKPQQQVPVVPNPIPPTSGGEK